jgi:seryl-tRNA synthetase
MFDLKWIRDCPEEFDRAMGRRALGPQADAIVDLDRRHRDALSSLQDMQQRRNEASKAIGEAKRESRDAGTLIAEVSELKRAMPAQEEEARALAAQLHEILSGLPNAPGPGVPDGEDESANAELRRVGEPPRFDFAPKQHFELGEALGGLDFEAAGKLAGARFTVMRGTLARLHRAIGQFMLDLHVDEHGYSEVNSPVLVRDEVLYGTAQLPKFGDDLFRTEDGRWLIPTAEVTLTNLAMDRIYEEDVLPQRVCAHTLCFRSEAGAAGKDTRGMLRQHQFEKVEMVSIAHPDHSAEEHERMTACAEEVLKRLGLAYRVIVLSAGDMGFGARKTYDLEVWLPGQDTYREISSCSNCWDFQARRMKARYRPKQGKGTAFVHTLNGSGVAVGRALIAVMENYQRDDGSIEVPAVLRRYMGGLEVIAADG